MRRNTSGITFQAKLLNALRIVEKYPDAYKSVGVMWAGSNIIKVDGRIFGALLGLSNISDGLFHSQGGFARAGFHLVQKSEVSDCYISNAVSDVDDTTVVLFKVPTLFIEEREAEDTQENPIIG